LLPYKNTKLRRRRRGKEALGGNIHSTGGLRILRQDSYRGQCPSAVTSPPPSKKACPQALSPHRRERRERRKRKEEKNLASGA